MEKKRKLWRIKMYGEEKKEKIDFLLKDFFILKKKE